jgi:hypothetical protein
MNSGSPQPGDDGGNSNQRTNARSLQRVVILAPLGIGELGIASIYTLKSCLFRQIRKPRPASACDSPWSQDTICPIKF